MTLTLKDTNDITIWGPEEISCCGNSKQIKVFKSKLETSLAKGGKEFIFELQANDIVVQSLFKLLSKDDQAKLESQLKYIREKLDAMDNKLPEAFKRIVELETLYDHRLFNEVADGYEKLLNKFPENIYLRKRAVQAMIDIKDITRALDLMQKLDDIPEEWKNLKDSKSAN